MKKINSVLFNRGEIQTTVKIENALEISDSDIIMNVKFQ